MAPLLRLGLAGGAVILACFFHAAPAIAADDAPRPTPATRPAMKRLIEAMKTRQERIPLPEPTDVEREAAAADPTALSYENRLRGLYLPGTELRGYLGFGGTAPRRPGAPAPKVVLEPDPAVTLDYGFKTRLFWIASRANNCQYCLGHQESKLLAIGMTDDDLARLDTDWSGFPAKERAALELAILLTRAPSKVGDGEIAGCLEHFTPKEVLELVLSVAGNNAINRWKEGIGVPQAANGGNSGYAQTDARGVHSYLTPTSPGFASGRSAVADLGRAGAGLDVVATPPPAAPATSEEIAAGITATRNATPRLQPVDEATARKVLGDLAPEGTIPGWMRLLAWFPVAGPRMVRAFEATAAAPGLDPADRARIAWTVARRNRAWYALALAEDTLRFLGSDDAALADLAGERTLLTDGQRAVLDVADALAASPVACTDAQFRAALEATNPATMTRVVHEVAMQSLFDRFTSAAGLPVD